MAILKCKMCGGTLVYDKIQNVAVCPYCDGKTILLEQDKKLFNQFQDMFATLLDQESKEIEKEGFWIESSQEELQREDGEFITIEYLVKQKVDICTMYVAKKHVIYIFEKVQEVYAERYKKMVHEIQYPNSEMEIHLKKYLPHIVTESKLKDGSIFLVIEKTANIYPLRLLGILLDRHVAWIISRLENICCLLNYNEMILNSLTEDNIFVDPINHQLYILGGWWFAGFLGSETVGASKSVLSFLQKKVKIQEILFRLI